jgi:hypothetical protein
MAAVVDEILPEAFFTTLDGHVRSEGKPAGRRMKSRSMRPSKAGIVAPGLRR